MGPGKVVHYLYVVNGLSGKRRSLASWFKIKSKINACEQLGQLWLANYKVEQVRMASVIDRTYVHTLLTIAVTETGGSCACW